MKTPKIRYYLENPKSKKNSERTKKELIMAEISYGFVGLDSKGRLRPKPFRYSLQSTIFPEQFGLITESFKLNLKVFTKATRNNATIRTKMSRLQTAIDRLENKYELEGRIPQPDEFKADLLIESGRNKKVVVSDKTILDYFQARIDKRIADSGLGKRDSINSNTIKTYKTVMRLIENYQIVTDAVLTLKNFNKDKYWEFWEVQDEILKDNIKVDNPNQPRKQRKQSYGYLVSTLRKYQVTLVKVLKYAYDDGLEMVLNVHDKNLILKKADASKDIYVMESELQKILDADLLYDKDLQMAKDYIIIGSLTGMRYESMFDTKNTKVEYYSEGNYKFEYIHSKQNKTKTEVYMPLLKLVKDVLHKYNNEFPVVQSNATINSKLKKLFKHLRIDRLEDEILRTFRSGEIRLEKPLHELITTHDCKKTFYTCLYNNKVNPIAIDNMTHPDATLKNRMAKIYNKSNMLDKAKMFVDEINKIDSKIYKF